MKTKTKRYLLLTGLIVVLIAVGYINFALGSGTGDNPAAKSSQPPKVSGALSADDVAAMSSESFDDYKANRENVRDTEIAYLDSIIKNEKSEADTIKDAQNQKIEIVKSMETELKVEELLVSSGFTDAIVTVKPGSVNVVLKATKISKEQAAQVLEIVSKETGEKAQDVKIILQK
jgi:stage III sporulation protein AH